MRTTVIRTKYSMGSGIVLIAEASEAILGTILHYFLFLWGSWNGCM